MLRTKIAKSPPILAHNRSLTAFIDRYHFPSEMFSSRLTGPLSEENGYFKIGDDLICYGRSSSVSRTLSPDRPLIDLLKDIQVVDRELVLPFDLTQIVDSLRFERFVPPSGDGVPAGGPGALLRSAYYSIRPSLPFAIRKSMQSLYLRGRKKAFFPRWPVDSTVEDLFETLLGLLLATGQIDVIPFIWFWPEGATAASIVTHDVETSAGLAFCPTLMDIDESFGVRSSYQIVPEERYAISSALVEDIVSRGHEVNIQDLNHDGHLFRDKAEFEKRVRAINDYGRRFGAKGFRSACLYHNLDWYESLEFEYDMSVPTTGHLEPQYGGCCTVFPYFIGRVLEIPVTTTQDYSLFYILRDYTLDLWKRQMAGIRKKHGVASFIVHPDYICDDRGRNIYTQLLNFLAHDRENEGVWISTPNQVNEWWRQRSRMTLALHNGYWRIHGPGSERAVVAFAKLEDGHVIYNFNC